MQAIAVNFLFTFIQKRENVFIQAAFMFHPDRAPSWLSHTLSSVGPSFFLYPDSLRQKHP